MNSQDQMLLVMLAAVVVALAVPTRRLGWCWSWDVWCWLALVSACLLIAWQVGPIGPWAGAAAGLLVLATVVPAALSGRFGLALTGAYDVARARRLNRWLGLFSWSAARGLREAKLEAIAHTLAGNMTGALLALAPYESPRVPAAVRAQLPAFVLALFRQAQDWESAVDYFELRGGALTPDAAMALGRAYLELGRYEQALSVLEQTDLPGLRLHPRTVAVYAIPYYALMGDLEATRTTEARLVRAMPQLRGTWVARCHVVRGEGAAAVPLLKDAIARLPEGSPIARRAREALAEAESLPPPGPFAPPAELPRVRAIFARAQHLAAMFTPGRPGKLVTALLALYGAVFVAMGAGWASPEQTSGWQRELWEQGVLWAPGVLEHGQWWRLLSYQLMHLHWVHLLGNALALVIFGGTAVRMYGPLGFMAIYLAAGLGGGAAQLYLGGPEAVAMGASGAIFGAWGAVLVGVLRAGDRLPARLRRRMLTSMPIILAMQFGLDAVMTGVAGTIHWAGCLSGALLALGLPLVGLRRVPAHEQAAPEAPKAA